VPADSTYPTSKDDFGEIPDAPFNQSQTILINGNPSKHRDVLNVLMKAVRYLQDKLGAGDSDPTTVGHVLRVTDTDEAAFGFIGPENIGTMPRAALTYSGTTQLFASGVATEVAFSTARYDTWSAISPQWAASPQPTRLVCRVAGLYRIYGSVRLSGNTSGSYYVGIRINGTTIVAQPGSKVVTDSGIPTIVEVSTEYPLAVDDFAQLIVTPLAPAGTTTLDVAGNYSPEFRWHWVMP
jgi:hypothetical protein